MCICQGLFILHETLHINEWQRHWIIMKRCRSILRMRRYIIWGLHLQEKGR